MFRTLSLLLLVCAAVVWGQPAKAASCNIKRPPPQIQFEELRQQTRFDHSKSSSQIAAIASRHRQENSYKNHKVRGFTFYRLSSGVELTFSGKIFKNNMHCLYIKSAKFKVGFRKMDVFIDRKYPKGSCAYKAILDHENTHVSINNTAFTAFLPILQPVLKQAVERMPVRRSYNSKRATVQMRDDVLATMNEMIDRFSATLKKQHAKIDTIESYRQVRDKCRSW